MRPLENIVLTAVYCHACINDATNSDDEELTANVRAFEMNQIIGYIVQSADAWSRPMYNRTKYTSNKYASCVIKLDIKYGSILCKSNCGIGMSTAYCISILREFNGDAMLDPD